MERDFDSRSRNVGVRSRLHSSVTRALALPLQRRFHSAGSTSMLSRRTRKKQTRKSNRDGNCGRGRCGRFCRNLGGQVLTYQVQRRTGHLFETNRHIPYPARRIQQTAEQFEITRRVSPHLLRHPVATTLLERGMPIEQIQKSPGSCAAGDDADLCRVDGRDDQGQLPAGAGVVDCRVESAELHHSIMLQPRHSVLHVTHILRS